MLVSDQTVFYCSLWPISKSRGRSCAVSSFRNTVRLHADWQHRPSSVTLSYSSLPPSQLFTLRSEPSPSGPGFTLQTATGWRRPDKPPPFNQSPLRSQASHRPDQRPVRHLKACSAAANRSAAPYPRAAFQTLSTCHRRRGSCRSSLCLQAASRSRAPTATFCSRWLTSQSQQNHPVRRRRLQGVKVGLIFLQTGPNRPLPFLPHPPS